MIKYICVALIMFLSPFAHATGLTGADILDTGVATGSSISDADAAAHPTTALWKNTTGSPIYIKTAQLFMGMDSTDSGDYLAVARRTSDNSIIIIRGWDHYAPPASADAANPLNNFSPDWVLINPNDGITLSAWACSVGNQTLFEVGLTIFYTIGSP